jgi:hypothetical protein
VAQRSDACIPRELQWVLSTQATIQHQRIQAAEAHIADAAPDASELAAAPAPQGTGAAQRRLAARRRPTYARDLFTRPGMIPIYNVLLVWALFGIDVHARSL